MASKIINSFKKIQTQDMDAPTFPHLSQNIWTKLEHILGTSFVLNYRIRHWRYPTILTEWIEFTVIYYSLYPESDLSFAPMDRYGWARANLNTLPPSLNVGHINETVKWKHHKVIYANLFEKWNKIFQLRV